MEIGKGIKSGWWWCKGGGPCQIDCDGGPCVRSVQMTTKKYYSVSKIFQQIYHKLEGRCQSKQKNILSLGADTTLEMGRPYTKMQLSVFFTIQVEPFCQHFLDTIIFNENAAVAMVVIMNLFFIGQNHSFLKYYIFALTTNILHRKCARTTIVANGLLCVEVWKSTSNYVESSNQTSQKGSSLLINSTV